MAESTQSGNGGVCWRSLVLGLGVGCGLAAVMYQRSQRGSVVTEKKKEETKNKTASSAMLKAKPKSLAFNFGVGQHIPTPREKHNINNTQYLVKPLTA